MSGSLVSPLGEERMRLIDVIGRRLSGISGYDNMVHAAARCAVPDLADLVVLLTPRNSSDPRLQVAHVDQAREPEIADRVRSALPAIRVAAERDIKMGRQFRWIPTVTLASLHFLTQLDPQFGGLFRALQLQSLMVVALRSGGQITGAIAFGRTTPGRPFQAADLSLAQVVARRIAGALETSALYELAQDEESRRARLEDALQKWIRVFDLAGWGAAVVDGADRRIEAVNPAFASLHGYPDADSLTGRMFAELLSEDGGKETESWATYPAGQATAYESVHLRADGRPFPVLTNVTAMELGSAAASYVVTVQDLTELKRAEERTRSAQRLEAVGRLAGGVAHEVNNMMTVIIGFSDLLAAPKNLPGNSQREVEEIRKAANRAAKITQQLLAFSRQQLLQPRELQLNLVVRGMTPVLRLLLPASVQVETVLSPQMLTVHADRAQLEQVLINLAFNARDAMPGGGTLRLATGSWWLDESAGRHHIGIPITPGQYAYVSVTDTGMGMDEVTIDHVFEPFFTTKPPGTGTGLGLASVYGIVKQSGGYVWLESRPREGTTITVSLPEVQSPLPVAGHTPTTEHLGQCHKGGTVLVIEDEEAVRELACRVLQQEGFRTLASGDAGQVIDALEAFGEEIDLVLSDVVVPDMSPAELERRVRERRPELPILYMSGYSQEEVLERGLIELERPFLQKPFTPDRLADAVCRQLEAAAEARGRPVST